MFLNFLNAQTGPKTYEVSPVEARVMMDAMLALAEAPSPALARISDHHVAGPSGDIRVRIYDPEPERDAGPVMVFFHGGGFVIGSIETHEPYCAEAARLLDMPVVSVDYRLAPEHPFPAAAEDCEAAARAVADDPSALGLSATGLILSGDSAGGNLTIVTAMALRDRPAAIPVLAQHPIYPVVSARTDWPSMAEFAEGYLLDAPTMAWFGAAYAAGEGDYRAGPLDFDQTGMPPTLITTASLDPLRDQGIAYYEKLRASGVDATHLSAVGNIHGHINLRKAIPSSQADIESNLLALKELLERRR
jgi:acetyl esterase